FVHHFLIAMNNPDNGAHRRSITVGIPTEIKCVFQGLRKISLSIKQRSNNRSGVQLKSVRCSYVPVLNNVLFLKQTTGLTPILRMSSMPLADIADDLPQQTPFIKCRDPRIEDTVDVLL